MRTHEYSVTAASYNRKNKLINRNNLTQLNLINFCKDVWKIVIYK